MAWLTEVVGGAEEGCSCGGGFSSMARRLASVEGADGVAVLAEVGVDGGLVLTDGRLVQAVDDERSRVGRTQTCRKHAQCG